MSENTKFNLEYAIKQGYRVADDYAASRVMFEKKHYTNNPLWEVFVNWKNGNFQEVNLNVTGGNQWVEMTNPGSAGIYYLLLRKGTPDQYRAHFGRHNGSTAPLVEWLGEALTDNHIISMATGTALLITFLWDGTKYIAHIVPKEVVGRIPKHGYLYNWYAINSGKLDIPGWHIPSQAELSSLYGNIYTVIDPNVGELLKATSPDWDGLDTVGFKGLPTGLRNDDGTFSASQTFSHYWVTNQYNATNAYNRALQTVNNDFVETYMDKRHGGSIRLMRNNLTGYTSGEKVHDIDGNVYDTVRITIGANYDIVWLKQNLATSRYNDGSGIPYVTSNANWAGLNAGAGLGAICAYNNDLQHVFE